jgi:hypothetical protein
MKSFMMERSSRKNRDRPLTPKLGSSLMYRRDFDLLESLFFYRAKSELKGKFQVGMKVSKVWIYWMTDLT